jgi:hypothetical protein
MRDDLILRETRHYAEPFSRPYLPLGVRLDEPLPLSVEVTTARTAPEGRALILLPRLQPHAKVDQLAAAGRAPTPQAEHRHE